MFSEGNGGDAPTITVATKMMSTAKKIYSVTIVNLVPRAVTIQTTVTNMGIMMDIIDMFWTLFDVRYLLHFRYYRLYLKEVLIADHLSFCYILGKVFAENYK